MTKTTYRSRDISYRFLLFATIDGEHRQIGKAQTVFDIERVANDLAWAYNLDRADIEALDTAAL